MDAKGKYREDHPSQSKRRGCIAARLGLGRFAPGEDEQELEQGHVALRYLRGGMTGPHQLSKGQDGNFRFRSEQYLNHCLKTRPLALVRSDLRMLFQTLGLVRRGEGL